MLSKIWKYMILVSLVFGCLTGRVNELGTAIVNGAKNAVDLCISLCAVYGLWCGFMRLAQESGLLYAISRLISPLIAYLFPSSAKDRAANEAITMNIAANLLGLGNAATPAGQQAIKEMARLSGSSTATPDMVMLLAIANSSVTVVPTTVIALRAHAGSAAPGEIYLPELAASLVACIAAVIAVKLMYRKKENKKR